MLYYVSKMMLYYFSKICFNVRMTGYDKFPDKAPFLIVSNHASLVDPPFIGVLCKKHHVSFMAKAELFNKVLGWWSRGVGCIEVKRGQNAVSSLKEAIRRLKDGKVVAIFPEGTRSEDGQLQDAKRGIGFLVDKGAVPVVPVFIDGTAQAFPKGGGIKFGQEVVVRAGDPIMPEELRAAAGTGKKDYDAVSSLIMEHIAALNPNS